MSEKQPLRVFIVEDSEFDSRILVNLLKHGGYELAFQRVDTAADLKKALAEVTWDVILADYNLPQFSAPAALKVLQESGKDLSRLLPWYDQ
jgi:CheY-like chemotaxis protein